MTPRPRPRTVVIGAGGLLGRNVLAATGGEPPARPIRWSVPSRTHADLQAAAEALADSGQPVRIAWCAGTGIVGTSADELAREVECLQMFLTALCNLTVPVEAVFLASSAGAVYAGATAPILDEDSPTSPTSDYGEWKLRGEEVAAQWGLANDVPVVLGRIANLYGPGQNLAKPQGLMSWLVRSSLLRQPLTLYVDLDTRREYLFAPDAGRIVAHALDEAATRGTGVEIRILTSGQSVTVGELVQALGRMRKTRVPVVYARNERTDLQPRSLVFASRHGDPVRRTPLAVGLATIVAEQFRQLGSGALS